VSTRPIPKRKREAIAEDIRAGMARNEIARKHGVSSSTVTLIAREFDLNFDRSMTKRATEAKVADAAALRAEVSLLFLAKAKELLGDLDRPFLAYSFAEHMLDRPPDGAIRNLMTSAAVAFDKHLAADRHDSDEHGLGAVDTWLRGMLGT
jgi:transposase-like protein